MIRFFIVAFVCGVLFSSCGELTGDSSKNDEAKSPGIPPLAEQSLDTSDTGDAADANETVDSETNTDFPTTPDAADEQGKDNKKKDNKDKNKDGAGPGGGAENCKAVFEDGYWKTWPKSGSKPALPASGPAPKDTCKVTTPSDTTGGSTNGKPPGNQRVLMKTSEGCYVPNGGGPVGPLLGACTGLTWRVPY